MKKVIITTAVIIFLGGVGVFSYQHFFSKVKGQVPTIVGQCVKTNVFEIGTRLQNVVGSGTLVIYTNGIHQVSYKTVQSVEDWRIGDKIDLCLVSLPTNCPSGDERGKIYNATNLRTGESWEEANSEHMCGGA